MSTLAAESVVALRAAQRHSNLSADVGGRAEGCLLGQPGSTGTAPAWVEAVRSAGPDGAAM